MRLRFIVVLVALGVLVELVSCGSQTGEYLSTFEFVWKKVNETFPDPAFGGVNWREVHDRYQPQIAGVRQDEAFYGLINRMLWELGVSHANLVRPGSFARYEPLVFAEGSPGVDIRLLDREAVVTAVRTGSPAMTAGLRPGYVIQAVDRIPVDQIVEEAERVLPPPHNSRSRIARTAKAILGRVYGAPGTEVTIAYTDEEGKNGEKTIMRAKRDGVAVGPNGTFFMAVESEARRLDNGIGYIRLNTLQPELAARVSAFINSMGDLRGIVFDLRGNSGGEIERTPELFLAERTWLYTRKTRNGETKVFVDPADVVFKGPLVLLTDATSGSASELLAACLQAVRRAAVVGERSPGAVMESDIMPLPNGALFMYPVAQLITPGGRVLEGRGVVPDIEIGLDREMLLKGIDSQLDTAVRYLREVPRSSPSH